MQRLFSVVLLSAGLTFGGIMAGNAAEPPSAKLSGDQAKAIAAEKIGGTAQKAKYEHEDGRWQYAVIVAKGNDLFEVEVEPNTGAVLANEKTSAEEETKEDSEDAKDSQEDNDNKEEVGEHQDANDTDDKDAKDGGKEDDKD